MVAYGTEFLLEAPTITGNPNFTGSPDVEGSLNIDGAVTAGASGGPFPELVATTTKAGVALINGTQNILGPWTAPNDGVMHRFQLLAERNVTSPETGGQMSLTATLPDGSTAWVNVIAAGGSGDGIGALNQVGVVAPNTTVTLAQTSALTVGTCIVYGELWAS